MEFPMLSIPIINFTIIRKRTEFKKIDLLNKEMFKINRIYEFIINMSKESTIALFFC